MSLASRRRLLLFHSTSQNNESLVTIDATLADACPYKNVKNLRCQFKINIRGTDYWYSSEYPLYLILNQATEETYFALPDTTYRNGENYTSVSMSVENLGYKNGIRYLKEKWPRDSDMMSTTISNYPIYKWEEI